MTMVYQRLGGLGLALLISACFCDRASGDVMFTTLGPGGTYAMAAGDGVNGQNASGPQYVANEFQPVFDGNLTSIELGITNYDIRDGGSGAVVLHLYGNDPVSDAPDTAVDLANGPLTATAATGSTTSTLVTFSYSGPALTLSHALEYWIVLAPDSVNTTVNWQESSPQVPGTVETSGDGMTFQTRTGSLDAFEVDARAVPEPAVWRLVVMGSLLGASWPWRPLRRSSVL
jgi:hypothetical protein